MFVPSKIFFTKGVGRHKDYLSSFELALRDAGIEKCNLVPVSFIEIHAYFFSLIFFIPRLYAINERTSAAWAIRLFVGI